MSAGEAVDAMLAEPRFAAWLPQMPSTTWAIGHVDPFSAALLTITFCNNPCDR